INAIEQLRRFEALVPSVACRGPDFREQLLQFLALQGSKGPGDLHVLLQHLHRLDTRHQGSDRLAQAIAQRLFTNTCPSRYQPSLMITPAAQALHAQRSDSSLGRRRNHLVGKAAIEIRLMQFSTPPVRQSSTDAVFYPQSARSFEVMRMLRR